MTVMKSDKELEKEINQQVKDVVKRMASDEITLDLSLSSSTLYEEFSHENVLNNDIYEYLFRTTGPRLNKKKRINITCHTKDLNEEDKANLETNLKNHFIKKASQLKVEIKKMGIISIILLLIGTLVLIGYLISEYVFHQALSEIILIFAWVFIWEATDIFFFQRMKTNQDLKKIKALYKAKINIIDD